MTAGRNRLTAWLLLGLIASVGVNLYFAARHSATFATREVTTQSAETYVCPMHPQVVNDRPADCPICGMKLVKQQEGAAHGEDFDSLAASVHLSPAEELLAHVQTEAPRVETFTPQRRFSGRITATENAQWKATARVMGRVLQFYVAAPGQEVAAGAPLYKFFSPELAAAQREYLLARQSTPAPERDALIAAARSRLYSLGLEDEHLGDLIVSGEAMETLVFHAPAAGVLMQRMAAEGEWVMPGMTLLEFADLSEVWAEGILFENDIHQVRLGDKVQVRASADPTLAATATVSNISALADMMTRTVAFRALLPNPDLRWKADMFVEITWSGQTATPVLTLPEDAVLATGRSHRVWVKVGAGRYQPRLVSTGGRENGRVVILGGIEPTDEVVVSGGYLIDSDAQLKNIAQGPSGNQLQEESPVTQQSPGKTELPAKTTPELESQAVKAGTKSSTPAAGRDVYICTMCPEVKADAPGRCPKCGMFLVKKGA